MSITDELRAWWVREFPIMDKELHKDFTAIADRIDAEHESKVAEVASGWDYWESTHIEMPKDADGEYIHVGDVMEWPDGETFDVIGIGEGTLFYVEDGSECADWTGASTKRHHHEPTVEDVLREFFARYVTTKPKEEDDAIIAEYAAKLQLKEDK